MSILHQSNRMESLFDHLVEVTSTPLAEVLRPETILVQSQGMARWLALEFTRHTGVSANLDCPFPAAFIWRLLSAVAGLGGPSPYEVETMRWAVMQLLLEMRDQPGFARVAAYLAGEGPELRRYQLAGKVAALLDQYQVHRPEWIEAWSAGQVPGPGVLGKDEGWQAGLWQGLVARLGHDHRVALMQRFMAMMAAGGGEGIELPERISLFGIPALPHSQLRFFSGLAQRMDVHLFLLAPSGHYWADLVSRKEMVRAGLRHGTLDPGLDLHLDEGCQLLMGLGGLGREFQALLQEAPIQPGLEHFVEPGEQTLLRLLQSDLNAALKLTPVATRVFASPAAASACATPDAVRPDQSIRIHAAHSPLREVEILHDQLLDLLSQRPGLEVDDILVMVPEISRYAPLVEAVFSDPAEEGTRLPFTIADRGASGPLVKGFFDLLDLLGSRAPVRQVLAFMEQDLVQSAPVWDEGFLLSALLAGEDTAPAGSVAAERAPFPPLPAHSGEGKQGQGMSEEDLALIRAWVTAVGVNWGLSAEDRARFGVPAEAVGTWRTGLERLLMGLLAPGDGQTLVHNLLPADLLEAGQGPLLARLANFIEGVAELTTLARAPRPLAQWRELFSHTLDRFFDPGERQHGERQKIRSALDELVQVSTRAGFAEPLPLEVVRVAMEKRLATAMGNFLCGRITFCQMVPMRSIPFKVVCLLGMNDTAFPRQEQAPGFDLMAGHHRPGDRSRRDDDRYLFLETILSARELLYLSYVGMSATNSPVPPSVVVSELIDHLAGRLGVTPELCAEELVTRHPLQPFSRRYFAGPLFSYSREQQVISSLLHANEPWAGLFGQELTLATEPLASIEVDDLVRFFSHPVRHLLRSRLGLYLDERDDLTVERERFSLNSLDSYQLMAQLTDQALAVGRGGQDLCPIAQLKGEVALGMAGRCQFEGCHQDARRLAAHVEALRGHEPLPARDITLRLDGVTLSGVVDGLWPSGLYLHRPGRIMAMKLTDLMRSWIYHLLLSVGAAEEEWPTTFLFRDGVWRYPFFPEARATLLDLIDLYRFGQGHPLPLFPKASLVYARKLWSGKEGESDLALAAARACWSEGDFFGPGEGVEDPYLAAVYGDRDPFGDPGVYGFPEVAARVLAPALTWGRRL